MKVQCAMQFAFWPKKPIFDDVDSGSKYDEVRLKYGWKNASNISRIYKHQNKWDNEFEETSSPLRSKTKSTDQFLDTYWLNQNTRKF